MNSINKKTLENLREQYPPGTRVELIKMNDPYNHLLKPGSQGTVITVDDIGTIHITWDCGSSLGIVYGEDNCKKVESE